MFPFSWPGWWPWSLALGGIHSVNRSNDVKILKSRMTVKFPHQTISVAWFEALFLEAQPQPFSCNQKIPLQSNLKLQFHSQLNTHLHSAPCYQLCFHLGALEWGKGIVYTFTLPSVFFLWFNFLQYPPANVGEVRDSGSTPGSGRSPGWEHGNLFQYSCLEKSHRQRSLEGYGPQGHKELDMNEAT